MASSTGDHERLRHTKTSWESIGTHLGVPVVHLFELHVLPSFAAQVEPLPLHPFHGRLLRHVGGVHFSHKRNVLACEEQQTRDGEEFEQVS